MRLTEPSKATNCDLIFVEHQKSPRDRSMSMATIHTHQSRQPIRVVGHIRSAMQFSYAMAWLRFVISHISGATRAIQSKARAATRAAFGQRQLAGLSIYRGGRRNRVTNDPPVIRTITAQSHKGAATSHQDQAISPSSLAAISAIAARQVRMSQFNGLFPHGL